MLQLPEGNVQLHVVMSEMALLPAQALATPRGNPDLGINLVPAKFPSRSRVSEPLLHYANVQG